MALQDSCENGNESTVEVEADVHLQTNDWFATFYITCYKGHDGTAQLLLKNGADVILQDSPCPRGNTGESIKRMGELISA